jgi:hypothetical protein
MKGNGRDKNMGIPVTYPSVDACPNVHDAGILATSFSFTTEYV